MSSAFLPIVLFTVAATAVAAGLILLGMAVGPRRPGAVKQMPYESGMDPVHDARRRFDVRFHLLAVAFLVFDVELLFLYPWAVASRAPQGVDYAVAQGWIAGRGWVFGGVTVFLVLLALGYLYDWKKGVLRWR
jgi:NADH-quinone oxidoreductase subunit A